MLTTFAESYHTQLTAYFQTFHTKPIFKHISALQSYIYSWTLPASLKTDPLLSSDQWANNPQHS